MAYLSEKNEFTDKIAGLDINSDVPNTQLANRTLFLKNLLEEVQLDLTNYIATNDINIINITATLNKIQSIIDTINNTEHITELNTKVQQALDKVQEAIDFSNSHSYKYASSDTENGSALTVKVTDGTVSNLNLVGTSLSAPTNIKKNTSIYMEEETLHAPNFEGNLIGNADSATELQNHPKITLTGDVISTSQNVFAGDSDLTIYTYLKEQNDVIQGSYGPTIDNKVSASSVITIPYIQVSPTGVITNIKNRNITLSDKFAVHGTTSALATTNKLYLLGANNQTNNASVSTYNDFYINNKKLYANNDEVVTVNGEQQLHNKVYEGFILQEACSHGVDTSINGTLNDNRLITSNSLARHEHKYAVSDDYSGKAKYLNLQQNDEGKFFLLGNNDNNGNVYKNNYIYFKNNTLTSTNVTVTDNLTIPGGKIWIEAVETLNSEEEYDNSATTIINNNNEREVIINPSIRVFTGMLLAYTDEGYVLADNSNVETCTNVVLAVSDSVANKVKIINNGILDIHNDINNAKTCYVGKNGRITFEKPSNGNVIKSIGYIENSSIIFIS